jgi:hypothetical protein
MPLYYQANGNLEPGVYEMTWKDFVHEFGYNSSRKELINGLQKALSDLKSCGCKSIYIDGSFTTKKTVPNDFDACWLYARHPVFFDFLNKRENQKKIYKGEFFPMTAVAKPYPKELYIDFFRHDKDDNPKGIIHLKL